MQRDDMLAQIQDANELWDFIIIGGGATGLGTAVDAASRGYKTLLLEQYDFGKGTSGKSTKLAHGGVRYLQQGNLKLVLEALHERNLMRQNAPHLVHKLPFIVPNFHWWEAPFYGIGLKLYDFLAGKHNFGNSHWLNREQVCRHIPTIATDNLRGGILYYDGQFDDTRLLINLAQTAAEHGATILNYMPVFRLLHSGSTVNGVVAQDLEAQTEYKLRARLVINATGVFADQVRQMDDAQARSLIVPSQGVHIVLDKSFLPGESALMIPKTDDGRVLFAIPWQNYTLVGTTDTPVNTTNIEPQAFNHELDFLISHTARYLTKVPTENDILSVFVGLRPLVTQPGRHLTKALSREHLLHLSRTGLLTIIGGKWTTYRKMAQDTIDKAIKLTGLPPKPAITHQLRLHGYCENAHELAEFEIYGADAPAIEKLCAADPQYSELLHPNLPMRAGEVFWAVQQEMARTVEDFLARRRRVLFQNARLGLEIAPKVATLMATALGKNETWITAQVKAFQEVASRYLPPFDG